MSHASVIEEIQRIQWLIIVVIAAAVIWYFRAEIKQLMGRLSKLEARRNDTSISATLDNEPSEQNGASSAPAPKNDPDVSPEEVATSASSRVSQDVEEVRGQMVKAYFAGDRAQGDELFNRLGSLEADPAERRRDQVRQLATEVVGGINSTGLESLEKLAETDEDQSFVYRMMGLCLEATERPAEAADMYLKAVERAATTEDKTEALAGRASSLIKLGDTDVAITELVKLLEEVDDRQSRAELLGALADAYDAAGDAELSAMAIYQVAALAGNNSAQWFSAGYALSQTKNKSLTILVVHCYTMALSFDSDHRVAKNNLGATLARGEMPILATMYYTEASELGNTLAFANMAENYLSAGFADDAKQLLEEASKLPNPNDKVAHINAEVAKRSRDERQKLQDLKNAGPRLGHVINGYMNARHRGIPAIEKVWKLGGRSVTMDVEGSELMIAWDVGGAFGARRFKGELAGAALAGRFEKENFSIGGDKSWEADGSGYGSLSESGAEMELVKLQADGSEYFTFKADRTHEVQ